MPLRRHPHRAGNPLKLRSGQPLTVREAPRQLIMAIKKIASAQLKPGMFIHDLNCGWMDHPFLTTRFKLGAGKEVKQILDAGIREVYIDTGLGLDVDDAPTAAEVQRELDQKIRQVAEAESAAPRATTHEELARARKVHSEANLIMRNIMNDV
ncbi:MAG: DUF3391 domain-containing protein, partial [Betaproteobacteria bacterium]|nr:DUF3391 domain-containing protein [Betaproteobacteria bacterium]